MNQDLKIGILGLGNMGLAIYQSIQNKFQTLVYDPYKKTEDKTISFVKEIKELEQGSDIVLICVKPDKVTQVLSEFTKPMGFISIAAGVKLETIRNATPKNSKVARLMPNLPLTVNSGASGFIGDKELYPVIQEIFSEISFLKEITKEELLDAVTGLSGSGPAFVLSFIHAMAEGGVKSGLSFDDSLELSIQTVIGTAKLLEKEMKDHKSHPIQLRNKVTSPGGTTIYGINELEKGAMHYSVMNAVFEAFKRARELG